MEGGKDEKEGRMRRREGRRREGRRERRGLKGMFGD